MRYKPFSILALALCAIIALTGCGTIAAGDLMANVKAGEKPSVPSEPDEEFVRSVGDFSWKILQQATAEEGNILVSPASIYLALAMTLNGADSTTRQAMLEALSSSGLTVDQINAASRDWMSLLLDTGGKTKLSIANSIWYRDGFSADTDFLQRNADYFSAAARTLDFANPSSIDTINGWVNNATNGTIDKIIEEISPDVVMYLINAVYFKAEWQSKFETINTYEKAFQTAAGEVKTEFMNQIGGMSYMKNEDAQGVLLPYSDGRFAFIAVLPDEGTNPRQLTADEDAAWLSELVKNRSQASVELSLPKFETRFETSLVDALTNLGMGEAFSGGIADFSLMTSERRKNLYISEVKHKTFCRVDEDGTEAAAVTSVEIRETSMPMSDIRLSFDRPFLYGIVDTVTGLPLFLGIMENPVE